VTPSDRDNRCAGQMRAKLKPDSARPVRQRAMSEARRPVDRWVRPHAPHLQLPQISALEG